MCKLLLVARCAVQATLLLSHQPFSPFLLKLINRVFVYQCASLFSVVSCFLDIRLKAFCFLCNKHLSPNLCAVQSNNVNESNVSKFTLICIFKDVKCIVRNSQRICIAFSVSPLLKRNLSSSISHVCVCITDNVQATWGLHMLPVWSKNLSKVKHCFLRCAKVC